MNIRIVEQHLKKEAAREAAVIANVIPVRLLLKALADAQNAAHALGQEQGLARGVVRHVDKGLVAQNVQNVDFAKALCQVLHVLDARPRIDKGIGLENTGMEFGHKEFRLGRVKVGKHEAQNVLVGLDTERSKHDKEGHGRPHKGEVDQNGVIVAKTNVDALDLTRGFG